MTKLKKSVSLIILAAACLLIAGPLVIWTVGSAGGAGSAGSTGGAWSASTANAQSSEPDAPRILVSEFSLTVDNGFTRYLNNVLEEAIEGQYAALVLTLDTPGGSLDATRDIVDAIINAPIPTVVYVPSGGRAASAGTFIASAANVLAMAPTSNIGAASPVTSTGEDLPEVLDAKVREDAKALIRSIAETRERNAELLESTVDEATSYSSGEALMGGIADLIATDIDDLIQQLDGMVVTLVDETEITLQTDGAAVVERSPNFGERLFNFVTNPTFVFIAFVLGVILILVEVLFFGFSAIFVGTAGLILLALAIFGFTQLPLSWLGLLLLALAIVLLIVEAQAPGIGVASVAAAVALVTSSLFIFNDLQFWGANLDVSLWFLIPIVTIGAAIAIWLGYEVRRSRKNKDQSELLLEYQNLVDQTGVVSTELNPKGEVHLNGEFWSAISATNETIAVKQPVKIVSVKGLHLYVEPAP